MFNKDGTAVERGCCPRLLKGGASSGGALGSLVRIERGAPNGDGGDDKLLGVRGAAPSDGAEAAGC